MTILRERLETLLVEGKASRGGMIRIMSSGWSAQPLGCGPGDSRFTTSDGIPLLYAARDFRTAFVETVVRDRYAAGEVSRYARLAQLESLCVAKVDVSQEASLALLDLRKDGPVVLGIPTDVVRAREHREGRAFGSQLFEQHPDVDGILWSSRLTDEDVIAVRGEAASAKMSGEWGTPLLDHPGLAPTLEHYQIGIL